MAGTHVRWAYFLWVTYCLLSSTSAGDVGCLFSEGLCQSGETCYNDGAFGRCVQVYQFEEGEPIRYDLDKEELETLEDEMELLYSQGYRWSHARTQCILQALLLSFQTGIEFKKVLCDHLKDQDLDLALKTIEGDQQFQPQSESDMAYIRYTPSQVEPNTEFADEVYVPPGLPPPHVVNPDEDEVLEVVRRTQTPFLFNRLYNTPDGFRTGFELKDQQVFEPYDFDEYPKARRFVPLEEVLAAAEQNDQFVRVDADQPYGVMRRSAPLEAPLPYENAPQPDRELELDDFELPDDSDNLFKVENFQPKTRPSFNYIPEPPFPVEESRNYLQVKEDIPVEMERKRNNQEEMKSKSMTGYSEGGMVRLPSRGNDHRSYHGDNGLLSDLLDELDELSFQRSERLDVKKPGPQFSTNNYVFQDTSTNVIQSKQQTDKTVTVPNIVLKGQKETIPNELPNHPVKATNRNGFKKGAGDSLPYKIADTEHYDVVDTTFAYIEFKDSLKTWKEGERIIKTVAKLLHAPETMFSHERMDRNEVTFKVVEPNELGLNASGVAKRIDEIKDDLRREIGVVVTSVGIGDKTKLPTVVKLNGRDDHEVYVVLVIVCGVLAALVLSAGVLYLTRRHGNKLANLTSSDTEPSKHYQDLCRARMSSKSNETGVAPPQRVTSLSRESDNSPSSRSSTSSWSEEPALSNMDVSTGQMVLSYMEDHLKNKERLDNEWTALCAYKADPCATTEAEQEDNKAKNRYPHAMPYDHARVVLNELSNITGSVYINASTITDHDPRNPAYIVTQGPLPATAPDFWQMVWEQGCVVIVMLTRLVENDNTMCHRYWPEEGSELYHIFEVHLVSEHIWCDDYLVRSFYLKNLKTGETRTVTQFHFLSWPDSSVPPSTKPLLEFRRKVNKSFRGRSCPIVVHCNDGIGRSGTYCLLDMVLNRMAKGAKEIDIAATLEHIRDQRADAVATKQQFQFVLSAVADEVQAILRVHPQNQ